MKKALIALALSALPTGSLSIPFKPLKWGNVAHYAFPQRVSRHSGVAAQRRMARRKKGARR